MEWVVVGAVVVGFLGFAQWRGWVDFTGKHESGGGMGLLGLADELFAPNRHEIESLREAERRLPSPAIDAPDRDLGVASMTEPEQRGHAEKYRGPYLLDL